jgi:hypothetical protein
VEADTCVKLEVVLKKRQILGREQSMRSRLLVSGLTIVVALLIEVAAVKQGLAQCHGVCRYGSIVPQCWWTESSVPVPRGGGVESVVIRDAINKREGWLPGWEVSRRAEIVSSLRSNRPLMSQRRPGCLCWGDAMCVPQSFTPVSQPIPPSQPPVLQGYCLYRGDFYKGGRNITDRRGIKWTCNGRSGRWYHYGNPSFVGTPSET